MLCPFTHVYIYMAWGLLYPLLKGAQNCMTSPPTKHGMMHPIAHQRKHPSSTGNVWVHVWSKWGSMIYSMIYSRQWVAFPFLGASINDWLTIWVVLGEPPNPSVPNIVPLGSVCIPVQEANEMLETLSINFIVGCTVECRELPNRAKPMFEILGVSLLHTFWVPASLARWVWSNPKCPSY